MKWLRFQWWKWAHVHVVPVPQGGGGTRPLRNVLMRCCRCGKRRVFARAVEMYPRSGTQHGWWHECIACAVDELAAQLDSELGDSDVDA